MIHEHEASSTSDAREAAARDTEQVRWSAQIGLAAVAVLWLVVVSSSKDLPIRDPDARFVGDPIALIALIIVAFMALDVVPRGIVRARRDGLSVLSTIVATFRERWWNRRGRIVVISLLSFYATYVAYRNLKSYVPFVAPGNDDAGLLHLEHDLFFGHQPAVLLHDLLGSGVAAYVLSTVYLAFLSFVPISIGAALIWSSRLAVGVWYVTALAVDWLLGTLSYFLVPSLGPVYARPEMFADLPNTAAHQLQGTLLEQRHEVLANPQATDAVQSIAAFASLHVAVIFTAALIAQRCGAHRALRWGLWTYLTLTTIATVYLGWHYVVDDVAGLAIGGAAVYAAAVLTGWNRAGLKSTSRWRVRIPNALTIGRIALTPVLVASILGGHNTAIPVIVFALGMTTDALDGRLARASGSVSVFGKLADPIADKLFVGAAFVCLALQGPLAWWVVAVVLGRELAVTAMRFAARRRNQIISANALGKTKTVIQTVTVLALLLASAPLSLPIQVLVYAMVAVTLGSGAIYLRVFLDSRARSLPLVRRLVPAEPTTPQ